MRSIYIPSLRVDLNTIAATVDGVLLGFITTLNNFMIDLEFKYNASPVDYPIPDGSILFRKLETLLQNAITYNLATVGTIVSATKPAIPVGRAIIWIDTNMADAD